MAEGIYTLLYLSVAKVGDGRNDFANLLQQNRVSHAERGITGLLIYANGHWIEFLEGERKTVEEMT
jgi:hypothetical protein